MKDLKDIIMMDLKAVPQGWTVTKVMDIMKKSKILVWDSRNGGEAPKMMRIGNKMDFKIVEYKQYKGE